MIYILHGIDEVHIRVCYGDDDEGDELWIVVVGICVVDEL